MNSIPFSCRLTTILVVILQELFWLNDVVGHLGVINTHLDPETEADLREVTRDMIKVFDKLRDKTS